MTLYKRYRAAQAVALGEIIVDLLDTVAPLDAPSEVGTEALARLEAKGFTLTALPVRDNDPLTLAAWGAVNAWDDYDRADWPDDAEALNQLAGSLAPWMEALHQVLADDQPPDDDLTGGDIAAMAAECEAQQERIADLELDNEGLSRHTAHMERYRMRATILEVAARRVLDAIDEEWPDGVVGTGRLTEESVDGLRALVDGQPAPPLPPEADPVALAEENAEYARISDGQPAPDTDPTTDAVALVEAINTRSVRGSATPGPTREREEAYLPSERDVGQFVKDVTDAAPSRDQVWDAVLEVHRAHCSWPDSMTEAMVSETTDAVMGLFGRSASEPPETQP